MKLPAELLKLADGVFLSDAALENLAKQTVRANQRASESEERVRVYVSRANSVFFRQARSLMPALLVELADLRERVRALKT